MRFLLIASLLVVGGCAEDDGYVALPSSDAAWASYVADGLLPASLPQSVRLQSIYQPCCDLNEVTVHFNLDDPANLEWLGPLKSVEGQADIDESYGQVRATSGIEVVAYGEVCDSGVAWRYLIATAGAGTAQQLADEASVCIRQEATQ